MSFISHNMTQIWVLRTNWLLLVYYARSLIWQVCVLSVLHGFVRTLTCIICVLTSFMLCLLRKSQKVCYQHGFFKEQECQIWSHDCKGCKKFMKCLQTFKKKAPGIALLVTGLILATPSSLHRGTGFSIFCLRFILEFVSLSTKSAPRFRPFNWVWIF